MEDLPVETRINVLLDFELRKMRVREISRKYEIDSATVCHWVKKRDYFVNKCLEIAKITSEGKLDYFLGEEAMKQEEANPKDLANQVKYLKQKLAYYEALAEECGLKMDKVSKKTIPCNQAGSRERRRKTDSLLQDSKHKPEKLLRFSET